MLAQLWRIFRMPKGKRLLYSRSLLAGIAGFLLASAVILLPFIGVYHQMIRGIVTFHTDAGTLFKATQPDNFLRMQGLLTSVPAYVGLFSIIVAVIRRDWRIIPLLAWLGATIYMLWLQAPLFHHHLVFLIPPILSLAIVGISPIELDMRWPSIARNVATAVTLIALLFVIYINWQGEQLYYSSARMQGQTTVVKQEQQAALDVRNATAPGQLVITDDQFAVGLADRDTPASLVDTSLVRIDTKYVTVEQLIQEASQPQVHAIFIYTGRLNVTTMSAFRTWIARSHKFHLLHRYGLGRELWVRI